MEFRILGPLEVHGERGALTLGGPKPRALLAMLLLHANEPVSAERLALALWGEDAPPSAIKRIQVHVSRLRKALGRPEILSTTAAGYRLRVLPGELDAEVFARLLQDGHRALAAGQAEHAAAVLREALQLSRGPPLADLAFEPFAQAGIARLEEQRLAALEGRVEADLRQHQHAALVGELRQLVSAHPARERLVGQLMLALYRCGRQGDALEVYARARAFLSGELGIEPGAALKALQRGILEQAPSLELQNPPATEGAFGEGDAEHAFPLPSVLVAGADEMFVGRAAEVEALADVYAQAAAGGRRLVLLCGEPGIGKTRLAAQFALQAHDAGAIVLYGRCDEEALLALQPFVEALRQYVCACPVQELAGRLQTISGELRRIVPELADRIPDLAEPLAGDPEGARARLFEAVSSLLCGAAQSTPVVLVLDDLHWADKATLLLLKYLARDPRQARLMVLGTYRETELDDDHPLSAMLAQLGRERLLERLALAPLDEGAVAQLIGVHAGENASPELRKLVYEGTEGNAFFVVEVLRHLTESGVIGVVGAKPGRGLATGRLAVPEGVKEVIGQRLARLGPETNRLLMMASVLGGEFELELLQRLSELSEDDLVDGLDSALRARVIEEVPGAAGQLMFSHALIRETLYDGLSAARRALLHRRAGVALERVHGDQLEPHLAELAHHFAQAGSGVELDKAIEYGSRAGEYALSGLAYEQAAAHFRQTVTLIDAADRGPLQRQRCDLVIAQGEAERQAGDPAYRRTLLDGARLAQDLHDPDRLARAALANNRGVFSSGQGVDRERVVVLHAALDAYDRADSPTRAALLALLSLELVTDSDWRLREKLSDDALAMARRVNDPRTLALVLTQRSVPQWTPSRTLAERRANLREAGEIADRLQDPLLAGHVAYLGAHGAMNAGDLEQADRLLARLSAVADQLGQPFMRWCDGLARAKRYTISGPAQEAERLAFAAVELGRRGGEPDSELWFVGQLLAARFLQGSLDRVDPHLPDLIQTPGSSLPTSPEITPSQSMPLLLGAGMSVILCEVGRVDDARRHFELLMSSELEDLPADYMALAIPAYASVACAQLGDAPRARRLHAILEPHSHRLVTTGASWFGATSHYLGLLAVTLDRPDEADARFAAAERTYASLDAKPWIARLRSDWATMLPAGRHGDDHRRAEQLPQRAAVHRRYGQG